MRKVYALAITLLITSCGTAPLGYRLDADATPEEQEMVEHVLDCFTECGLPDPSCPINLCRADEPCQEIIENCGAIHLRGGKCMEIFIDTSRERCTDPARTLTHELLHALGFMHGPEMYSVQQEILALYRHTN